MTPEEFLSDLPKVHVRPHGRSHPGGLNPRLGKAFIDQLAKFDKPAVIETGAGNSTLLFLMLGCTVTSISPDPALYEQIITQAEARGVDTSPLTYFCERSEVALPKLATSGQRCQAAFIDGNHGWPSVMVDFCYLNFMLQRDGILFIDDIQIYACSQLMLLLRSQPQYADMSVVGKMAIFRKVTDAQWLPDSPGQPFIMANSTNTLLER
jgi:hypothetical protein